MAEDIQVGDWVKFKSSGFVNEGRITKVEGEDFRVEVPNGATSIYLKVSSGDIVSKIDAPPDKG